MIRQDPYAVPPAERSQKRRDFPDLAVVHSRNVRHSELDFAARGVEAPCVIPSRPVAGTRVSYMEIFVDRFYVVQKRIGIGDHLFKSLAGNRAAGIDGGIYTVLFQPAKQLGAEIRPAEALTARKSNSASGRFVEIGVLEQQRDQLVRRRDTCLLYIRNLRFRCIPYGTVRLFLIINL